MKIALCYPPIKNKGNYPNLPQNRQFIYTASKEVRLYPVVMASAATWLRNRGNNILWLDAITRRMIEKDFNKELENFNADLIVLETKAPIMKKLWLYINNIKKRSSAKIVLVGDHSTYFPQESLKKSKVDYVLTGGDYDFLLVNLVEHIKDGKKLKPGIFYRSKGKIKNSGKFILEKNLDITPVIDRNLTRWQDYGEAYLFHPCAYVMFGRGCGINSNKVGSCTFCIWQHALWGNTARRMSPYRAVKEVRNIIETGAKEIFDDSESGVFADKNWLLKFFNILKKERLLGKIVISSNARADQLDRSTCKLLKNIGYRLVKVGVESGSDITLDKINKKEDTRAIEKGVKNAKDAGLRVMLTVMFGYPWESEADAELTYEFTQKLLFYKTRAGDCLQVSRITPYPGTPLWSQSKINNWLTIDPDDYRKYDMSVPVLKEETDSDYWVKQLWSIQKKPWFIIKSAVTVRNMNEAEILFRGAKSLLGHILDFQK